MRSINKVMRILGIILGFYLSNAFAFSGFLYVDIKGEVLSKPCSINNGQNIEINFGDVMTTRVQDENYKEPIDYTVSCTDGVKPQLNIFVDGISADFDPRLLKTNVDNLAVLFKANNDELPLKYKRNFDFANPVKLYAVLIKQAGTELPAKSFTATATLKVAYP